MLRGLHYAILVAIFVLDQATKWYVVKNWEIGAQIEVIPGFFSLVHFRNTGAAWGMLHRHTGLLALFSVAVLVYILVRAKDIIEGRQERAIALALVIGGILGNLLDRVWRESVVDFLLFYYHNWFYPAFNVADSAITCGVIIYLFSSFFLGRKNAPQPG